jgi:hypothetical protein
LYFPYFPADAFRRSIELLDRLTRRARRSSQVLAVAALMGGSTVTEAAEKAGVSRETVSRWVHHDPAFIAELQNRRAELIATLQFEFASLGKRAIEVMRDILKSGTGEGGAKDFAAAVKVLEMLGLGTVATVEPTTPREVAAKLRDREQRIRLEENSLDLFAATMPTGTDGE